MIQRVHVVVSGRVQGVCYRMDACAMARRLGLHGWVRNLPDGRVEMVAEGEASELAQLVSWCRQGPAMAIVRGLDESFSDPTGEFDTFRITY